MKQFFKKIKEFTEKHTILCLILIFVIGIVLYGIIAKSMTSPIYFQNDEEIYVNMAKSLFYNHNFSMEYKLVNYSCVIYSAILSLAYFFYSPENILFIMRMIGVIAMMTSVFPIYLLSKKVLNSKSKALIIAAISLIIPEMMSSVYLIQENLSYPMYLWITYFVYSKFERNIKTITKNDIIIIILLVAIFFTKSYTIAFAAAYFIFLLIDCIRRKEYKEIKTVVIQGFIFSILILIGLILVKAINGFENGVNHYDNQINEVFPITLNKIRNFFIWDILLYFIFSILYGSITSYDTNIKYKAL